MGIPFTVPMGFLFTVTMGILLTIALGIQLTISNPVKRSSSKSVWGAPEPRHPPDIFATILLNGML